ncbi:tetratricopeptide repeat protein, partial [bacterium]|nr:tetratricopeptide repeat protein [bacterium]
MRRRVGTLRRGVVAAVLAAGLAVGATSGARAQGILPDEGQMVRSRLHLADEYMREDRHEEAMEIYRQILDAHPTTGKAQRGLKECLLELKRYDELSSILEEELASSPDHPAVLEQLGTVAARQGDRAGAARWWRRIIEVQRYSASSYSFVADLLARNRLLDESLEVYGEADQRYPGRFTRQKASLHEQRFEFDAATDEYLNYLDQSPTGLSYVEGRLLRIGEAEEGLGGVIDRVVARITAQREAAAGDGEGDATAADDVTAVTYRKLLGDLYLEAGDHESARKHYFALVDEVPGQYGSLLVFGKRCQTDGKYDVAIRVFERMVDEFPTGRAVPSALTEIARSQRELGRWEDALSTYARLSRDYPETDYDHAARFEAGQLRRDGMGDAAAAEATFRELLPLPRGPWGEADPQFEVAECALWLGDLERAGGIFRAIGARDFGEPTKERALFEEARAVYYAGEFAQADSLFKEVAQRYPKGDHVNDALEFSILINTNRDGEDVLR